MTHETFDVQIPVELRDELQFVASARRYDSVNHYVTEVLRTAIKDSRFTIAAEEGERHLRAALDELGESLTHLS